MKLIKRVEYSLLLYEGSWRMRREEKKFRVDESRYVEGCEEFRQEISTGIKNLSDRFDKILNSLSDRSERKLYRNSMERKGRNKDRKNNSWEEEYVGSMSFERDD